MANGQLGPHYKGSDFGVEGRGSENRLQTANLVRTERGTIIIISMHNTDAGLSSHKSYGEADLNRAHELQGQPGIQGPKP